jgi:hypothetical protein
MCVLAGLVALPHSASAQAGEAARTSEPNLKELSPSDPVLFNGLALAVGGTAGMVASGILKRRSKREARDLK